MIVDITNEVYTNLKDNITNAVVLKAYPSTNPTFPCVTIEEISNTTNPNTIDTDGEQYNDISFEINIFSDGTVKLSEAMNVRKQVDDIMSGQYRMSRGFSGVVPNFLDTNVQRYTLRYTCTISSNKKIYRR